MGLVSHHSMSRSNLKFKNLQWGFRASYHVQTQSEIENFQLRVGGSVIFPCPGQFWNLYFLVRVRGQGIFPCPDPIWNSNLFWWEVVGSVIFPWNSTLVWRIYIVWSTTVDSVIFPGPEGKSGNLKFYSGFWVSLRCAIPNPKFNTFAKN